MTIPLTQDRTGPIVYAHSDDYPLTLNLFLPNGETHSRRPAILLFHGGGWVFGISGPQDMAASAERFAEAGCVAATVAYRRTGEPDHPWQWPAPFRDCQQAVRWLRRHSDRYDIDPACIIAYGHSAGGHLAAMVAVRDDDPEGTGISSRVNGSIAIAGHMDLHIPYDDDFGRESLAALLGGAPADNTERTSDASPLTWVDAQAAPMLLAYGHADHQVIPAHHRRMADALQHAGVAVSVVELPDADHFTIAEWPCVGPWALAFVTSIATGFGHRIRQETV